MTTNLTRGEPSVHVDGLLWKLVRASMTIVGLVPPVTENGELLIDGGYLNNMPVDVMRGLGVDTVSSRSRYQLTHSSVSTTDSLNLAALARRDVEELFSASGLFSTFETKKPFWSPNAHALWYEICPGRLAGLLGLGCMRAAWQVRAGQGLPNSTSLPRKLYMNIAFTISA